MEVVAGAALAIGLFSVVMFVLLRLLRAALLAYWRINEAVDTLHDIVKELQMLRLTPRP